MILNGFLTQGKIRQIS